MIGLFLQLLLGGLALYALYRSIRLRFWSGAVGGVLRAAFAFVAIPIGLKLSFPPGEGSSPSLVALGLGLTIAGPVVSFSTLYIAHRATRNLPVKEEERLAPRFSAWLPIAGVDAGMLVIAVAAQLMSSPW